MEPIVVELDLSLLNTFAIPLLFVGSVFVSTLTLTGYVMYQVFAPLGPRRPY
jgi:hypothetical protein